MTTELTEEQKRQCKEYVSRYIAKACSQEDIDPERTEKWFQWLYKYSRLEPFKKLYVVDSPAAAQKLANELCNTTDVNHVWGSYGGIWDLNWIAFYSYCHEILGTELNDDFFLYKEFENLNVYDSIQFDEAVIVVRLPLLVSYSETLLHGEDTPPLVFRDGDKYYVWRGVRVPEKLIETPDEITADDILTHDNAEVRRCFMEKLGAKKYYDILSGGDGVVLLDEDVDNQGNTMRLYETSINDSIVNKKVQFIEVVCPSTKRVYNIFHPKDECTNVWEAKASTFSDEKIQFRQGDVGLLNLNKEFDRPEMET